MILNPVCNTIHTVDCNPQLGPAQRSLCPRPLRRRPWDARIAERWTPSDGEGQTGLLWCCRCQYCRWSEKFAFAPPFLPMSSPLGKQNDHQAPGGLSSLLLPSSPQPRRRRHHRCHLPQPQGGELKTQDSLSSASTLDYHLTRFACLSSPKSSSLT